MIQEKLPKKYRAEFSEHKYDIIVGTDDIAADIIECLQAKTLNQNVALVFDTFFQNSVYPVLKKGLSAAGYKVYPYPMQAGKHNKTISEAMKIYELLETNLLSRDSTMIALGGGVIGDLAGFVASTYHRGINLIAVPTTLTAMIDSSIGGKVAINFRKTINAIGNYYHPILNIIDFQFIDSLSQRDFKAGLAEIIKCAVIDDEELFDFLSLESRKVLNKNELVLSHIMRRAIEIKLKYVSGDIREQGKRLKLNYGHTLGHAVEVSTDVLEEVYRHGEGVSLGMVGAAFLALNRLKQGKEILLAHEDILFKYGLPTKVFAEEAGFIRRDLIEECMSNIYKDKKKHSNSLRFILPNRIGDCGIYNDLSEAAILEAFNYIIGE
ncbi:MAG: 3-dehydroquinate synthase family protein [Candidatus Omnitrophota bacterium]